MATDNRTNEQLAERLRQFAESQAMDFDNPHIAMTLEEIADRLTGTITEAQVEAAARVIWKMDSTTLGAEPPESLEAWEFETEGYLELARAVLVAAQGAAPSVGRRPKRLLNQLNRIADALEEYEFDGVAADAPAWMRKAAEYIESERQWRAPVLPSSTTPQAEAYDHCCQHPKCPGGSLCCCASEQRLRDCWNQWREEIAGDSRQAFRDGYQAGQNDPAPWLTAPVLPSSGVDEDALAEVIANARNRWAIYGRKDELLEPYLARAVAEWLKGQGNAARE